MRRWLAIVWWQIRSVWRSWVPNPWLRRGALAVLAGSAILLTLTLLLLPVPPAAARKLVDGLGGFAIMNLALAVGLATAATATLVRQPERSRALLTAPLPPAAAVWLPLAAVVGSALLPLCLLFLPFCLAAFRFAPGVAGGMLVLSAVLVAWALHLSLLLVLALVRRCGSQRGTRLAYALAAVLALAMMAAPNFLLLRLDGRMLAALLAISTLTLLPRWMTRTAGALQAWMTEAEPVRTAPEPTYGSRALWLRLLRRSPALWGGLTGLTLGALFLRPDTPLFWGLLALLLVSLALMPLNHLLAPEYECPDRFRLAPGSHAVLRSLLLTIALPTVLLAWLTLLAMGKASGSWRLAVGCLVLVAPFSCAVLVPWPRRLAQGCLVVLALLTEVLQ